jgi:hypothetical protein
MAPQNHDKISHRSGHCCVQFAPSEEDTDNAPVSSTLSALHGERIPRTSSRLEPLKRSSRRESALISPWFRWSGLTSAATRFMVRGASHPRPSDGRGAGGEGGRFDFVLATTTRTSAKTPLAKPDRRSVGETELHYFWIQLFHSLLNDKGRAAFAMANSAPDATDSDCPAAKLRYHPAMASSNR